MVDGHNRHRIWRDVLDSDEDKAPDIHEMPFKDRDAVKEFMLKRQLSRRNLTDAVRVVIALKLKPVIEAKAKSKQSAAGGKKTKEDEKALSPKLVEAIETHQEIANAAGVSHETVRKVEAVLNSENEEIKAAMLAPKSDGTQARNLASPRKDRHLEACLASKARSLIEDTNPLAIIARRVFSFVIDYQLPTNLPTSDQNTTTKGYKTRTNETDCTNAKTWIDSTNQGYFC